MTEADRSRITEKPRITGVRRIRRGLYLLVLLAMLFHLNDFAGDTMGLSSMTLTLALVDQGTVVIDDYVQRGLEMAWHEGHFYSGMPPGQSFIAVPLYMIARPVLVPLSEALHPRVAHLEYSLGPRFTEAHAVRRVLLLALYQILIAVPIAAAAPVMLLDLSRRMLGEHARLYSLALLMGVGSIWWAYGAGPGPRTMAATAILFPLWWLLCRRGRLTDRRALWGALGCGLGLALAFAIRYETVIVAVPIALFFLLRARRAEAVTLVLGGLLGVGLVLGYHAYCFGNPLTSPYDTKITPLYMVRTQWETPTDHLEKVIVDGEEFAIYQQKQALMRPGNIATALLTTSQSLLWFTPALLLSVAGIWLLIGRHQVDRTLVLTITAALLAGLAVLAVMPHPGFRGSIGPRYILPSLPYWFLLLGPVWLILPRIAHAGLFALSFIPSYFAAMFTSRLDAAWDLAPLREFGLSTYVLSRLQEAGVGVTPAISTTICILWWAIIAVVALRLLGTAPEGAAEEDTRQEADR